MILNAESNQVRYVLAIDWTEATDGTPAGYDDGTSYDYIEATLTARLTPSEIQTVEAAWQSSTRLLTIESTGFLLGPTIDTSTPGVEVRIMDFKIDGPADSAMTLFDVTMEVRKGSLASPSSGSLDLVQASGVPYHSDSPLTAAWGTESGGTDVATYGRVSTRSCAWYTEGLTNAQAADVVNALRTLRVSTTAWNTSGNALPFGPGEGDSHTVYIPSWELIRESNLTWMARLELVRSNG